MMVVAGSLKWLDPPRRGWLSLAILLIAGLPPAATLAQNVPASGAPGPIGVAPQYGTTHVYVAPADLDAFVTSFLAVFGGRASRRSTVDVTPVPSSTDSQAVMTPEGSISVFAFRTPLPYPFGQERTGYLVADLDQAVSAARAAGADVMVEPFTDPIGRDAIIQWPGGVKMQLYWHFQAPNNPPLATIPENRVYVSKDQADNFVRSFVAFAQGRIIADDTQADAGEIGRPGETCRRIRIRSVFGNMLVWVTDGHLPFPFGREITGYEVQDFAATLEKAKAAGVTVLFKPYAARDRTTAVVEFPGGFIAEIHSLRAPK
jgi:predicted enzyme related to lactoylglutathione lyase